MRPVLLNALCAGNIALGAGSIALGACNAVRTDCAALAKLEAQDSCYFERTVKAAEADDLDGALAALEAITAPAARSFATEKILVARPTGLTMERANALCTALDPTAAAACLRYHSRPHLWAP